MIDRTQRPFVMSPAWLLGGLGAAGALFVFGLPFGGAAVWPLLALAVTLGAPLFLMAAIAWLRARETLASFRKRTDRDVLALVARLERLDPRCWAAAQAAIQVET